MTKRKLEVIWIIFLLAQTFPVICFSSEGTGGRTGDGSPYATPKSVILETVPAQAEVFLALQNIARFYPSFGYSSIELLKKMTTLKNGNFALVQNFGDDGYHFAEAHKKDRGRQIAKIVFWNKFGTLPDVDDAPWAHSKVKEIIHELGHILINEDDEENNRPLTETLYQLARNLSPNDESIDKSSSLLKGPLSSKTNTDLFSILQLYTRANQLQQECGDIEPVPIVMAGRALSFPKIPAKVRKYSEGDSFYSYYRKYCFEKTFEGKTFLPSGELLHPIYNHPFLFLTFLQNLTGTALTLHLNPESQTPISFDKINCKLFYVRNKNYYEETTGIPIVRKDQMENLLTGYNVWRALFYENLLPGINNEPQPMFKLEFEQKHFFTLWHLWLHFRYGSNPSELQPTKENPVHVLVDKKFDTQCSVELFPRSHQLSCVASNASSKKGEPHVFTSSLWNLMADWTRQSSSCSQPKSSRSVSELWVPL